MQQTRSPRHEAALAYAAAGIPIFPCKVNAKEPATERGFYDATTDRDTIDRWWAIADYNLALCPENAGWAVVDIDRAGGRGDSAWLPESYLVSTPSGGSHIYYAGSLPSSVRKLNDYTDTRGRGGYVLVPPSVVDGKAYTVANDNAEIEPLPDWLLNHPALRATTVLPSAGADDDLQVNVARAEKYLSLLQPIFEGQRNTGIFRVICDLRDLGISGEKVAELLDKYPLCDPPLEAEEIARTVLSAYSGGAQNAPGAKAVVPVAAVFSGRPDLATVTVAPEPRSRFYFKSVAEQEEGTNPAFLYDKLVPDQATVLIVGAKGTFKSFFLHHLLLGTATGLPSLGLKPLRTGTTIYGAHEGRAEIERPRRRAWENQHARRGSEYPFFVGPAPRVLLDAEKDEFKAGIRDRLRTPGISRIAGIGLDTVAKCMTGLDENTARDAGLFVQFCDELLLEFECPVYAIHHTTKAGVKGGRGSGALEAGFQTVIDIEREPKSRYMSASVRFHKDAQEPDDPWRFVIQAAGNSAVLLPINERDYQDELSANDPVSRKKVGAALDRLNARGEENSVTTAVLASELTPRWENETADDADEAQKETAGKLKSLARGLLAGYVTKTGRDPMWALLPLAAGLAA